MHERRVTLIMTTLRVRFGRLRRRSGQWRRPWHSSTATHRVLAALPPARILSFCEASLFSLVTHLPFRKVMDVGGYPRLNGFCRIFAERPAARATEYHFDTPPA